MPPENKNPVLYKVGDIEIRENNWVKIRYNSSEYARLAKVSLITGLPIAKLIALSSQPCKVCGNDTLDISIPLGIISTKKQNTGSSKILKKRNDDHQA